MKKTAILILTDGFLVSVRYVIENLLRCAGEAKPYIILMDNGGKEPKVETFFSDVCHKVFVEPEQLKYAAAINKMLKYTKDELNVDYVCIFRADTLVNESWLNDLAFNLNMANSAGVVGIKEVQQPKIQMSPVLFNSERGDSYLQNVWKTPNIETVSNVIMFEKKLLSVIGALDERLNASGYEIDEFCFRAQAVGLTNFYIRKQCCMNTGKIGMAVSPKRSPEATRVFTEEINRMAKEANFFKN